MFDSSHTQDEKYIPSTQTSLSCILMERSVISGKYPDYAWHDSLVKIF